MATTYTIVRRERVGRRKMHVVDITIGNTDTLPITVAPSDVSLQRLDDVVAEQCTKSDFTQGYSMQWDPVGKQLLFLGSNGATPDLVRDTSANNALVARARFEGV